MTIRLLVVMDIRMPGVDGLTATERLRSVPGAPEVVMLTAFHADEQVPRVPARPGLNSRVRIALLVHEAGFLDEDGHVR